MMDAIPKKGVNLFCNIVGDMLFETDKGMPILLFLIRNLDFGYSLELPLTCIHDTIYVLSTSFFSKAVKKEIQLKNLCILHGQVCVMGLLEIIQSFEKKNKLKAGCNRVNLKLLNTGLSFVPQTIRIQT